MCNILFRPFRLLIRLCLSKSNYFDFWLLISTSCIINTDILHEKAKFFAQQFEINNFTASNGWINKFKQHNNLKEYVKWGEPKSVPLEILDEERKILHEIIKNYDLNNVFNCDETGNS